MRTPRRLRRGFTLIELLVAIGIILIIAAIGYYTLPSLLGNQNRARAVDQLTEWLLTAKIRARRDGLATGLRILVDPTTNTAAQVAYIQQPDPFTGGSCDGTYFDLAGTTTAFAPGGPITAATMASPIQITSPNHGLNPGSSQYVTISGVQGNTAANNTTTTPTWVAAYFDANNFTLTGATGNAPYAGGGSWTSSSSYVRFSSVDFLGPAANSTPTDYSQALVQPGDYLEVNYSGNVHLISAVTLNANATTTLTLNSAVPAFGTLVPGAAPQKPYATTYRILRQPRLLIGEEIKSLGADLVIDFNPWSPPAPAPSFATTSLNVPTRTVVKDPTATPPTTVTYYEILFSPNGSVVGLGTTAGKIVLWLTDKAITNTPAPPALVAINTRTGFIGAYEANITGTDPYSFTEDGRSGGF
jgi:prepilin-type N-terminal cleavage/methylation domain-containing protein